MDQERFVKVPEELLRGLARLGLTGAQAAVSLALLANLYHWPEPRDRLSSRYLAVATGLDRRTVRRALDQLGALGVLAIGETRSGSRPGRIAFRPVEAWRGLTEVHTLVRPPEVGAPVRPVSGRPSAPGSIAPTAPLLGAPVRHQVGAPVRHKVRERELQEWNTPPPGKPTHGGSTTEPTEESLRVGLSALESAPESEFRTQRMAKVRAQLDALAKARA